MAAFVWGAGGAQLTPEQIAERRKVAAALMQQGSDFSPVRSPWQGAARVAQAMLGGFEGAQVDAAEKTNAETNQQLVAALLGGQGGAPMPITPPAVGVNPTSAAQPMGSLPTMTNTVGKIYENDEPSPLDPPSGADRDRAIRTIVAEAGNQGPTGMNAVASVIRNRAARGNFGGDTPSQVVTAPNQFEPWNTAAGRQRMAALDPNGAPYQAADAALTSAYAGNDPTNGATHFYAPKAQAALGRSAPRWDNGTGVDIGDHRFFGGAPVAAATPASTAINPAIAAALTNPAASPATQKIAALMLQQQQAQNKPTTVDLGNEIGVMRNGQIVQRIPKSRDPMETEAKRLDLETKRRGLDAAPAVRNVKQADGSEVAVQWDRERQDWVPLKAPQGGNPVASPKLTEVQSKDVGFYNRGSKILPRLEEQDKALTDFFSARGGEISNYFKSDAYRQAEQTGRELLAVILRKDTGAAVTPDEMTLYGSIYLPQPGDDPATIEQKRLSRQTAIEGIRMGLGTADIIFRSREALEAAKQQPAAPTGPSIDDLVKKYGG